MCLAAVCMLMLGADVEPVSSANAISTISIAQRHDVAKHLNLSEEQRSAIGRLQSQALMRLVGNAADRFNANSQANAAARKEEYAAFNQQALADLEQILNAEQRVRLRQVVAQAQATTAPGRSNVLINDRTRKQLAVDDQQWESLSKRAIATQQELDKELDRLRQAMIDAKKRANAQLKAELSDAQKAKYDELFGELFAFE